MKFWDSSAIVPLLIEEATSAACREMAQADPQLVVWWSSPVECVSALARRERDGALEPDAMVEAVELLSTLELDWIEIEPSERLRAQATRLLRVHSLRAGDSLQLAAALVAAENAPRSLPILTLDERLAAAARREGFAVLLSPVGD